MVRKWLRHLFRDRIGPASTAPLRGIYPADLIDGDAP